MSSQARKEARERKAAEEALLQQSESLLRSAAAIVLLRCSIVVQDGEVERLGAQEAEEALVGHDAEGALVVGVEGALVTGVEGSLVTGVEGSLVVCVEGSLVTGALVVGVVKSSSLVIVT